MTNAMMNTDGYKLDHRRQYPAGTEFVYSNWTARGSRIDGVEEVIFFGLQHAIRKRLMEDFEAFFAGDVDEICNDYQQMLDSYLGPNEIGTDHIRALHNLGYLPLEFKALPEGTPVPLRVPMLTVENTHPDFFWLTNYFETILSSELWLPMTSATNAARVRRLIDSWAMQTVGNLEGVSFLGHDFSMRGMSSLDSAITSGMGHLVAFTGTETVPALDAIKRYYPTDSFIAGTVPATEHSVMCAGGEDDERETYERMLDLYPSHILSIVSDTWDYWNVITNILPSLKDKIMARADVGGKLVVRPDSGDPADIVMGTEREFGKGTTPEEKGTLELLWEIFGGTVNEYGYKVLHPSIGMIYGDAMNYERIGDILARMEEKGFATTHLVFGLGSFHYQYHTRDTFQFAMKATNVIIDGVDKPIHKSPKTDGGMKRSLKGRVAVIRNEEGRLIVVDEVEVPVATDLLQTVWKDGEFVKEYSFDEVRENAGF